MSWSTPEKPDPRELHIELYRLRRHEIQLLQETARAMRGAARVYRAMAKWPGRKDYRPGDPPDARQSDTADLIHLAADAENLADQIERGTKPPAKSTTPPHPIPEKKS